MLVKRSTYVRARSKDWMVIPEYPSRLPAAPKHMLPGSELEGPRQMLLAWIVLPLIPIWDTFVAVAAASLLTWDTVVAVAAAVRETLAIRLRSSTFWERSCWLSACSFCTP